ncbi:MAG: ABC transporter ATP-binding protein [Rhizobiales bacterium]|nr:ABC transporter ATP-binding protein [Hyphomicrobiales bacterium]
MADRAGSGTPISFRGIEKRFGGVSALSPVTLDIEPGEFLTLLGPSGSGKTTLLNIVAGLVGPSAGQLWFGEEEVTDLPARERGVGMVFQNYALMPHLSVFENIAFPLRVRKISRADIAVRVKEVLQLVGMLSLADRRPRQLSGGQQQRVSIARCLVYKPSIVLMDEPLGALDKKLRMQLQLEIKRLHEQLGFTALYVTHDQDEAMSMSDRICLMDGGRTVQISEPTELYFRPQSSFAAGFLGEANLFEATLVQQNGHAFLEGAGGLRLGPAPEGARPGSRRTALLRPENVRVLATDESAENEAIGQVSEVAFFGGDTRLTVTLPSGMSLVIRGSTGHGLVKSGRGETLRIGWCDSAVTALPEQSA